MTANELRQKYLDFMKEKGHAIIPSASLIPENDPTTLFTGSGMQPMIPYLLGEKHPLGKRIADSQKSFRSVDIEEVGDNRHTTFFEMLGNWSLGDYFKQEQIQWMFEFLTKIINLDPNRIYVTVFRGKEDIKIPKDAESVDIWKEEFKKVGIAAKDVDFAERDGMQGGRIFYYDETKNWWSRSGVPENMPIGEPGGPDSEMFWDFGEHLKLHENSPWKNKECHVNCDCGRFLEIGNNVFMQYLKTEKGFEPLAQKNVDYGGGLERQMAAVIDNPDIFLTDLFQRAIKMIEELSGKKYKFEKGDLDYEKEPECWTQDVMSMRVIADHLRAATFLISDGAYPSNKDQGYFVRRLIRRSVRYAHNLGIKENFCAKVAEIYIEYFKEVYPELKDNENKIINELEKEEEKFRKTLERGLRELEKIVNLKDESSQFAIKHREDFGSKNKDFINLISGKETFDLYQTYGFPPEMIDEELANYGMGYHKEEFKEELKKHQELSRTAAEGKFKGGLADHSGKTTELHTVAHLMLAGLRKVLGLSVHQKGSNINGERIRFDFSHSEKMTDDEKKQVEEFVNEAISAKAPVTVFEMTPEEARESGAEGEFSHKYGDRVKVYSIEEYSKEICGGPHVKNTGDIKGVFRIKKEESSSAGVRRIKAAVE